MWPCGVPQGLGRLGPWSSTAACVVGATGNRGGLLVRRAACHFGGMRGAVAIFDIKNTGMPRIINTLAQLLIIDMLCPAVSLDFGISLSTEHHEVAVLTWRRS